MEPEREDECRYCEHDRRRGWIFCRSCGTRLSPGHVTLGTSRAGTATPVATSTSSASR